MNRRPMNDKPDNPKSFDARGLRAFIVARDRQHNPFFVGRQDTIRRITECLALVNARCKDKNATGRPAQGLMQLVQGAPGVGKTSLLNEIEKRCIKRLAQGQDTHKVIPIVISDTKQLSVTHVNQQLREGMTHVLDRVGNEDARVMLRDMLSFVRDINLFGLRLGKSDTREFTTLRLPKNCTILLMIDEIQTASGGPDGEPACILQELEAGSSNEAILPVLAGLANSSDHLDRLGLSRLSDDSITRLQPLSAAEVIAATEKFIAAFGIRATHAAQDLWTRTLYRWSKGWPKHLQNGMSVLGSQLLTTNGNLDTVDLMAAQRVAMDKRIQYYWTRFGDQQHRRPALLGNVMAHLGRDPVTRETIETAIRDTLQKGVWGDTPAPKWDDMLHRGLIDINQIQARGTTYVCPIPSLRSFAVTCTAPSLHGDVLDGNLERVQEGLRTDKDVNDRDAWMRTALHIAAQENWPDLVTELLAQGASLEAQDQWGRTPLHLAAHDNAELSLAALLVKGADVHACDQRGETPLHHAARKDSAYVLQQLLDAQASPQVKNRLGKTARDLTPNGSRSRRLLDAVTPDDTPD